MLKRPLWPTHRRVRIAEADHLKEPVDVALGDAGGVADRRDKRVRQAPPGRRDADRGDEHVLGVRVDQLA